MKKKNNRSDIIYLIKGSDLDGDCYFICWDKRFIPENQREPFNYDEDESKHK